MHKYIEHRSGGDIIIRTTKCSPRQWPLRADRAPGDHLLDHHGHRHRKQGEAREDDYRPGMILCFTDSMIKLFNDLTIFKDLIW